MDNEHFMLKKIRELFFVAVGCVALGNASAAQPAQTNAASIAQPSEDAVVARAKGLSITRGELKREAAAARAQIGIITGHRPRADKDGAAERQVLEQLINIQLLGAKATAADKAEGKEQAEKRFAAFKAKYASEDALDLQLKYMETTREELLAKWTAAMVSQAVLKREFKINITDQEARKYYDENPAQFEVPDSVRASHVFFNIVDPESGRALSDAEKAAKRQAAEAILKRARAGEDFGKLARESSEDLVSKARGGEYTFAHGGMVPEVEAAAFAMSTNQIGDIVTSTYGYHIIKVIEKIPAHKMSFAEAAPGIKNALAEEVIKQRFPEYVENLRKEANVQILDDRLKPKEEEVEPITSPGASTKRPG
jgi:peptidyl-prolyl cis-trans isomerase C